MKIILSVTNDLVTDQRVHKVCTSLSENGYEVKLLGRKMKNSSDLNRNYKTNRFRLIFNKSFLFYAEYNIRLFFYLLFEKTDIYLSNDTDTLLANYLASCIRRKPLVFDAHEMFPEVPEVVNRKRVKLFWTALENWIFPKLKYCYTVCQSIADVYNRKYSIDMRVIRNIPFAKKEKNECEFLRKEQDKKIILYQGAVNVGRGIDRVIDAMPYLDDFVFYVVGGGDILEEMKDKVKRQNLEDKVFFTGQVPFEQLPGYTAYADIGVNFLENKGLNYYYSLPNRIFDYIRSEIPILSVDFPEIRKIVQQYGIGLLINDYSPENIAKAIKQLSTSEKNKTGFQKANEELTWENEAIILTEMMKKVKIDFFRF